MPISLTLTEYTPLEQLTDTVFEDFNDPAKRNSTHTSGCDTTTGRQSRKSANGSTNGINLMLVQTDGKKNTPNNNNNVEPQQGSGHTPCHFDLLTVAKK